MEELRILPRNGNSFFGTILIQFPGPGPILERPWSDKKGGLSRKNGYISCGMWELTDRARRIWDDHFRQAHERILRAMPKESFTRGSYPGR
jgi:hypothetical protein